MKNTREKIAAFRSQYPASLQWGRCARTFLRQTVDSLYRGCQEFATTQIRKMWTRPSSAAGKEIGRYIAVRMKVGI